MKKNLRIVSAAAAALLAVAPVAAVVVPAASTTVSAADTNKVVIPKALTDNSEANLGTFTASAKQIANVKNSDQKVSKPQLTNILQYNGLSKGMVVNYIQDVSTVGSQISVKFQLAAQTKDAKEALAKLGYTAGTGAAASDTSYQIVKNGSNTAVFTVVLSADKAADTTSPSESVDAGFNIPQTIFTEDANTSVNISAIAGVDRLGNAVNFGNAMNGNIVYTDGKGTQHTALLHGDTNTTVYAANKDGKVPAKATPVTTLRAGHLYVANFNDVTINLGNSEAGKSVKFVLPANAWFAKSDSNKPGYVQTVTVDQNGVAHLGNIFAQFYAYDPTDLQEVHFYSVKTGNVVNSGSVNLHAVNGKLNINSLFVSMTREYVASQLDGGKWAANDGDKIETLAPQNDLRDQLKKQNISVDANGYFTAPASFTLNLNAKSAYNGATASLPVTVTVDNAAQTPAANETTKNVTIMHIATIYDKNGMATHEPALRAYNSVSVVSDPVSLKDEKGNDAGKFYKLAGKDQYIKVGNVDGTSRSLKHNSYVYKSTGKRNGKKVLKKGSSVTTYGKSFMIAGHQMYRIGKNQYVKKANF